MTCSAVPAAGGLLVPDALVDVGADAEREGSRVAT
jgi:hypothetical protein